MNRLFIALLFIGILFSVPTITKAQFGVSQSDVQLILIPDNPGPFTDVRAEIRSFSFDVAGAPVEWSINGEVVSEGIGERFFQFRTGDTTDIIRIEAAVTPEGSRFPLKKSRTLQPLSVDLLWEAPDSWVTPFYRGKALPAAEGQIKAVAFPSGIDTTNGVLYGWTHEDRRDADSSGFERSSYLVRNSFFNATTDIEANVSVRGTDITGTASVRIPRYDPVLLLGTESPAGEMTPIPQNRDYFLKQDSKLFQLFPFFMSTRDMSDTTIVWRLNGNTQQLGANDPRSLIIGKPAGTSSGFTDIETEILHDTYLLQTGSNETTINF